MADARMWLAPTLTTFAGIVAQWGRPVTVTEALARPATQPLPAVLREYWARQNPYTGRAQGAEHAARMLDFQRTMIRVMQDAGVGLLAGTDTPLPIMMPGSSLHDELAELVGAGLTPWEALTAATSAPGRFVAERVDSAARFGRVAVGYRADLLLVEGDPLDSLARLRRPVGVMAAGRWIPRDSLERLVAGVPAAAARRADAPAPVTLDEAALRRFVGRYVTADARAAVVSLDSGQLRLTVPGQAPFVMGATSATTFRLLNSVTGLSVEFTAAADTLRVRQGGRTVVEARRSP